MHEDTGNHGQNQEPEVRGLPAKPDPAQADHSESHKQKPRINFWTIVKEGRDTIVAISAIVALLAVYAQLRVMEESNALTRESNEMMRQGLEESRRALVMSQRAEIGVESTVTEGLPSEWGLPVFIRVTIRNTGQTTATRMRVISGAAYLSKPIQPNYPIVDKGKKIGSIATLPPNGTAQMVILIPRLTRDAFEMFRRGEAQLYAYGDIVYLDGFGNKRRTRFCAQYESGQWGQCPNNNEVE